MPANLAKWGTGGLRRASRDQPFTDVMQSEKTSEIERRVCDHPTLKPQSLLRPLAWLLLPLERGVILDPFMGSGATVAAAQALGVELDTHFYELAVQASPRLVALTPREEVARVLLSVD